MISKKIIKTNIVLTVILTVIFPIVAGLFINSIYPDKIVNILLHSGLEVSGGVIAIIISMMFFIKYSRNLTLTHFNYTSLALLTMGIIDIAHGMVSPGKMFVWLHSTAVFFGGIFFISVWLKDTKVTLNTYKLLPIVAIFFAVIFSIVSVLFPSLVPTMLNEDKTFSTTANWLNVMGGIGFFIASIKFIKGYIDTQAIDELLFAGVTMLFGIAGILFVSSVVWDMQWWLWHFLRLGAYVVALSYLYIEFNREVKAIEETNQKLKKNKEFTDTILLNSGHAIITTDIKGNITLFNKKAENLLGYSSSEVVGICTPVLFHQKEQIVQRAKQYGDEQGIELEPGFEVFTFKTDLGVENLNEWIYISKDGKEFPVMLNITQLTDPVTHTTIGYMGIAEDISQRKKKEKQIKEYLNLIDKNIITSTTDLKGNITYVSQSFCDISGYSKEELLGKNHRVVKHHDMDEKVYKELWNTISEDKRWCGEIKNRKKDGGYYWVDATITPIYDEQKVKVGYTAIRQDITDKKMIELISITDGLTNIYNRRHFNDVFPNLIQTSKRSHELLCFLIMDIDHFKQYNDTYGHQMGDDVLIKVAACIKDSLHREEDTCFRLGGEEFGILFKASNKENASNFANTVRENIENLKIEHSGNSASSYLTASMGLVCKKASDIEGDDVAYKQADDLLYEAKESGRNKVVCN